MSKPILEISNLTACYGKVNALKGINFYAYDNEIVGLVGPNGAGKTTLMESIAGLMIIKEGQISFLGVQIEKWPILKRRKLGIMLMPQEENIFPMMSVKKNLDVSVILSNRGEKEKLINYVYELFPVLYERKKQIANTLSGGEQKMLAIGIAIASNAKLILIDEPSIGLAPKLVTKLFETLKKIKEDTRKTIVLSEQSIKVLSIADRLFGLEAGEIRFAEKTENLNRKVVKDLYMGSSNNVI